mmetsp:Transcript_48634/g.128966  ORF Transcript_48634/g.128966 Transcript_48634/m.128966 type:complete len:249 (+) Transcript_48634:682-1428(+)
MTGDPTGAVMTVTIATIGVEMIATGMNGTIGTADEKMTVTITASDAEMIAMTATTDAAQMIEMIDDGKTIVTTAMIVVVVIATEIGTTIAVKMTAAASAMIGTGAMTGTRATTGISATTGTSATSGTSAMIGTSATTGIIAAEKTRVRSETIQAATKGATSGEIARTKTAEEVTQRARPMRAPPTCWTSWTDPALHPRQHPLLLHKAGVPSPALLLLLMQAMPSAVRSSSPANQRSNFSSSHLPWQTR